MRTRALLAVICAAAFGLGATVGGQEQFSSGQNVAPVFEGWEPNADGTFSMVFGYMNRNYEELLNIPVGPNNSVEPGGPDQGQPARLFPRRSRFVFRVTVSKDFGKKELVWTLTAHGRTEKAYGSLRPEYVLDNRVVMMNNGGFGQRGNEADNKAPVIHIDGDRTRTVKVGQPLTLSAETSDDGIPASRTAVRDAGDGGTVLTIGGLRAGWIVYRGPGDVSFTPEQFNPEFRSARRSSPLAPRRPPPPLPKDGKVTATATFATPGVYVLRFVSHDGGLASYEHVTVTVTD